MARHGEEKEGDGAMNLSKLVMALERGFDLDWDRFDERIPSLLARPDGPHDALWLLDGRFLSAAFVNPRRVALAIVPLQEVVDRAAVEEDAELLAGTRRYDRVLFNTLNLANVIECVGGTIAPATLDIFRRWLPELSFSRDDADTSAFWSTYYIALALDDRHKYRRGIMGPAVDDPLEPPDPAATHGPDLRAFLRHIAAAVEQCAPFASVAVAWEDFLRYYPLKRETDSLDHGSLLWAARVVYHRIAGYPLGTVAQHLHDDLWRLAALE
jgi:hypothetical protein